MDVNAGSTSVIAPHYFVDDIGGTNPGEPTTGLLFSDIETGGSASFLRQGEALVDVTLKTQTVDGAYDEGGFVLVDDTKQPGHCRCDWPDAAFAAGVDYVILYLQAASGSNTITRPMLVDLTTDSAVIKLPQNFLAVSDDGSQTAGTFADTQFIDSTYISRIGISVSFIVNFAIGSGNFPFEVVAIINHEANGNRNGLWEIFNFDTVGFDTISLVPNNGVDSLFVSRNLPSGDATDYSDASGNVQFRFTTDAVSTSNMQVDFLEVTAVTEQGDIPTAAEIAAITAVTLGQIHGSGNWEGDYTKVQEIESITSQTEFVLTGSIDGIPAGSFLFVYDGAAVSNSGQVSARYITNYQADTPSVGLSTVTIDTAQSFTVTEDMRTQIRLNLPVNVDAIDFDRDAATNLKNQFDGTTGLTGDLFPATQAQANSVASGGGGLKKSATGLVITTGTETGGALSDTESLNSVVHEITNVAGTTRFYYEFNVGVVGVATGVIWNGFVNAMNDEAQVFYFDWISASFKQIDTISGQNGTDILPQPFDVPIGATDSNGDVRIELVSTDAVSISTDRIWIEYTSVAAQAIVFASGTAQSGGENIIQLAAGDVTFDDQFVGAKVLTIGGTGAGQEGVVSDSTAADDTLVISRSWAGENPDNTTEYVVIPAQVHSATRNGGYDGIVYYADGGATGTLINVNGTTSNPVGDEADAYTIAADSNVNANIFNVRTGSTFVIPSDSTSKQFIGSGWFFTLNDQTLAGIRVTGASFITGVGAGTASSYLNSAFGAVSLESCSGSNVGFGVAAGVFTIIGTGSFIFGKCGSVSTTTAAVIDFDSNAATLDLRDCSGHIEIQNAPAGGVCMIQSSGCEVTINANCSSSMAVILAGVVDVTNNASVVINNDANAINLLQTVDTEVDRIVVATITNANDNDIATDINTMAGVLNDVSSNVDNLGTAVGEITKVGPTRIEATTDKDSIISTGNAAWTTGGGGAAPTAVENREEMDANSTQFALLVARTANGAQYANPVISAGEIELDHYDEYDGVSRQILVFPMADDHTGADSVDLTIWLKGDTGTTILEATATLVTATEAHIPLTAVFTETLNFSSTPLQAEHRFAVVAQYPSSKQGTGARGKCTIFDQPTPTA